MTDRSSSCRIARLRPRRPLGVEVGAGVSSTGEKSAGRARRGITLEDEGDAELNGTADDDGVGGAGGGGAGGELGYGGGGGRARPVVVEGGAGISRAGQKSAGRARRGSAPDGGDALLDGTADGDSSGGRGAGRSLGYGGGGRARPLGVEGGAGVSHAGLKSAGRARRGITLEDEGRLGSSTVQLMATALM